MASKARYSRIDKGTNTKAMNSAYAKAGASKKGFGGAGWGGEPPVAKQAKPKVGVRFSRVTKSKKY